MYKYNHLDHGQTSFAQRIKIPEDFRNTDTGKDVPCNHEQMLKSVLNQSL